MVEASEILESIKTEMSKYSEQYETLQKELKDTISSYRKQLEDIQAEGDAKIGELQAKIEQVRGMYTSLYDQYQKFADNGGKQDVQKPNSVEQKQDKDKTQTEPSNNKKEKAEAKPTKSATKTKALSDEDKAKLSKIAKAVDAKGNEVPDYLVDEYNKK